AIWISPGVGFWQIARWLRRDCRWNGSRVDGRATDVAASGCEFAGAISFRGNSGCGNVATYRNGMVGESGRRSVCLPTVLPIHPHAGPISLLRPRSGTVLASVVLCFLRGWGEALVQIATKPRRQA